MFREDENEYDISEESMDDFLVQAKVDEHFHDYLINVLNHQLDALFEDANRLNLSANTHFGHSNTYTQSTLYDCESFSDKELFDYLSTIWMYIFN